MEELELKIAYRKAVMIGGAIAMTLFTYIIVALVMEQLRETASASSPPAIVRNILLFLSIAQVAVMKILRDRLFNLDPRRGSQMSQATLIQKLLVQAIITFALAESIAVFGFVWFLISGSLSDFFLFLAVSSITFILFFPRYYQWEDWLKKQQMESPV